MHMSAELLRSAEITYVALIFGSSRYTRIVVRYKFRSKETTAPEPNNYPAWIVDLMTTGNKPINGQRGLYTKEHLYLQLAQHNADDQ